MNNRWMWFLWTFVAGSIFGAWASAPRVHAADSSNSSSMMERMVSHQKEMVESQKSMAKSLEKIADKCK